MTADYRSGFDGHVREIGLGKSGLKLPPPKRDVNRVSRAFVNFGVNPPLDARGAAQSLWKSS